MPAIKAPATVLVTGASGFIACWVCKTFLEAGFTVRGTVRSPQKGDYLANIFAEYKGRFEYIVVEDMIKQVGAFDEAVKGVQGLIVPALHGTVSVLKSIEKNGSEVERVVITSSGAAILDPSKPTGTVFTDDDWNTWSVRQVEEKGRDAGHDKYRASKVLAEQAAWEEAKKQTRWDLVTIHPLVTLGPIIHQVSNPSSLNTSISMLYKIISSRNEDLKEEVLVEPDNNFGDVRDVALAHLRAMELENAGGQRFIACKGAYTWQDALDALPEPYPRGIPNAGKSVKHTVFDSTKASQVLGINFRSFEESVRDTTADLQRRGWIPPQ
ncbi:D-lactaldehyde dehydrogenase [Ceratobasidium theobromae]|uniref:D-lactaldehyde dehydrogenase n=1 Tax=Ceratobasidium theobromae TaxID=1582974 RepID=A0A5N5QGU2_9AGAM|nr:D-lactaldehyde dehydrogenase [Ceratobasidium theobromae]